MNAELHNKLGNIYLRMTYGQAKGAFAGHALENAIQAYENAIQYNPVNAKSWYALGRCYKKQYVNINSEDSLKKADLSMEMAVVCSPKSPRLSRLIGEYWVWRSSFLTRTEKQITASSYPVPLTSIDQLPGLGACLPKTRTQAIARFQSLFQHSLSLPGGRRQWKTATEYVSQFFGEKEIVKGIIPPGNEWVRSRVQKYLNSL